MIDKHFKDWAVEQHVKTNHVYDEKLPYAFHLGLVVDAATKFKHVWTALNLFPNNCFTYQIMYNACWGHDLIEDTRVTYNDIVSKLKAFGYNKPNSQRIADIIFALTNNKGKTRAERANADYYDLIVGTKGAIFVKLCDRIANVKYSELTKSSMFKKYKEEHEHFMKSLGIADSETSGEDLTYTEEGLVYEDMVEYLEELLGIE